MLLGLRNRPEMTALWRGKKPLITTRFTEEPDLRAWRLWGLWTGLPDTLPEKERVVRIEAEQKESKEHKEPKESKELPKSQKPEEPEEPEEQKEFRPE